MQRFNQKEEVIWNNCSNQLDHEDLCCSKFNNENFLCLYWPYLCNAKQYMNGEKNLATGINRAGRILWEFQIEQLQMDIRT